MLKKPTDEGELDVGSLKGQLRAAANLGLRGPIVDEAVDLAYGISKLDLLDKQIALALSKRDTSKLVMLVQEAEDDYGKTVVSDQVENARDYLAFNLPPSQSQEWHFQLRVIRARIAKGMSPSDVIEYNQFLKTKDMYRLSSFTRLRTKGQYLGGTFFGKRKTLKEKRFVWQKEDIPRSFIDFSHLEPKRRKFFNTIAKQIFKNILGIGGDVYHAYPVTLAYEVINTGVNEELLRDEIFCQLIKQTTNNPNSESLTHKWKTLYLCVSTFWPSSEFAPILLSYCAAHAPQTVNRNIGFNEVSGLAYHCYAALQGTPASPERRITILEALNKTNLFVNCLIPIIAEYWLENSPPYCRPPFMTDIEKLFNGI